MHTPAQEPRPRLCARTAKTVMSSAPPMMFHPSPVCHSELETAENPAGTRYSGKNTEHASKLTPPKLKPKTAG